MPAFTLLRHLNRSLRLNAGLVLAQTEGLTHADSLRQPAEGGNRLNWHLGHMVWNRLSLLEIMGVAAPCNAEPYSRYQRDSQPVADAEDVPLLSTLLADFSAAQAPILEWLGRATDAELDEPVPGETYSVADRVAFLIWHETMHVGQLEQYRRLAGHTEKVV